MLFIQGADFYLKSSSCFYTIFPQPLYPSVTVLLLRPRRLCTHVDNPCVCSQGKPFSSRVFLDTDMEHTKSTTISMLQRFLNTMHWFLHDFNDGRGMPEGLQRFQTQGTAKQVKTRFISNTAKSIPDPSVPLSQDCGHTFYKCQMVPEIIILNEEWAT